MINPDCALAHEYRGSAYFVTGNLSEALSDFSRAIQLDPTNATVRFNRGSAYRAMGNLDAAMSDFNVCLRINPTNGLVYKNLAAIHNSRSEFADAIKNWDQGLWFAPNDASALVARGWAYFMTSEFGRAASDYQEAIHLDPGNDLAYNNLGWLRATAPVAEARNGKEAVEAATRACELTNWRRGDWIDTLAAAYAEAGDFQKAVACQKQAIDASEVKAESRVNMQRHLLLYEKRQAYHDGQRRYR